MNDFHTNIQLSKELKSTMNELIMNWIILHYVELEKELNNLHFHTKEDANTYLIDELFRQRDRWCFGKYLKDSNQITTEHLLQMIQHCSNWYYYIDFKNITDLKYIGFYFGMIYIDDDYIDLDIVQIIKEMTCTTPLK